MMLRPRRRNLVVWGQSAGLADRDGAPRAGRTRLIRRRIRTGVLLTIVTLMPLVRAVQARWRLLLTGAALTVAGVVLRGSPAGAVLLLPGLMLLMSAPLIPATPKAERLRRSQLERELAAYATPTQRRDLEATLDRYPDGITRELRDILARQATAAANSRIPGCGRL